MPLPNVVFFPRSLQPLHIFEQRYVRLVEAILSGDRLMGLALLKPGWEGRYYDSPAVHKVMGVGKIIEHERLDNGSYDIWLSGLERVEIIHEVQEKPFRVAKVRTLTDGHHPSQGKALASARRELVEMVRSLAEERPDLAERIYRCVDEQIYPGTLADRLAGIVCPEIYERQCILSEINLTRRVKLVTVQARARLAEALVSRRPNPRGARMAPPPGGRRPPSRTDPTDSPAQQPSGA